MGNNISVLAENLAENMERKIRTATVSATDAWGTTTHYEIEWLPEIVRGVMLGEENLGRVPVVWAVHPPVVARKSNGTGIVHLATPPVQVTGERERVVEGVRVDRGDELQPGTFRVVREWDGA